MSLVGQENGHVDLVEWPPSSASPAIEGQQLGLLNASFPVASTRKSEVPRKQQLGLLNAPFPVALTRKSEVGVGGEEVGVQVFFIKTINHRCPSGANCGY